MKHHSPHGAVPKRVPAIGVASVLAMAIAGAPVITGCANSHSQSPYAGQPADSRDSRTADEWNARGVDAGDDLARAEECFRQALAADIYHGPAHNNLGVVFLRQGKLYEAAGEFEWARKLMPGQPDPRLNLALTLERAGQVDEALTAYAAALEAAPHHLPSLQGLARLRVRAGTVDDATIAHLREIAIRGDERWRTWAVAQLDRAQSADTAKRPFTQP